MKSAYVPPTVVTRGDVVRGTLGSKPTFGSEPNNKKVSGGSNLSFGL